MTTEQVHIVIGATGGIGSALCRRLVQQGLRVVGAARDEGRLQTLAAELGIEIVVTDATRSADVDELVQGTAQRLGRLDGVTCCAGSLLLKPAHRTSDEEWLATIATNLNAAFFAVRAAVGAMQPKGGSIALVSSVAARLGLPNHEAIAAAKGGVEALVRAAAASYAPRGIRVNAVAPGLVRTPLTARLIASEAGLKASVAMHPLGRIGEPDDIASALAWLLDPANGWVTGQVIGVDGGMGSIRRASG